MQTLQIIFYLVWPAFSLYLPFRCQLFPMLHDTHFFRSTGFLLSSSFCYFLTNFWSFPLFHASHTNADIIACLLWAPCEKYKKTEENFFFRCCTLAWLEHSFVPLPDLLDRKIVFCCLFTLIFVFFAPRILRFSFFALFFFADSPKISFWFSQYFRKLRAVFVILQCHRSDLMFSSHRQL